MILFGSCNALLVPFITSFHILITFSYGSPSCMMYINSSLVNFVLLHFDNYTPRSGRGLGLEGEYPNALCFFEVRGRAPTRNV